MWIRFASFAENGLKLCQLWMQSTTPKPCPFLWNLAEASFSWNLRTTKKLAELEDIELPATLYNTHNVFRLAWAASPLVFIIISMSDTSTPKLNIDCVIGTSTEWRVELICYDFGAIIKTKISGPVFFPLCTTFAHTYRTMRGRKDTFSSWFFENFHTAFNTSGVQAHKY